ncbi:MAG: hypothetical protein FWC99_02855 [Coriobacteriia bacterium]|nr:hypothetical protein [Coriobacteriia bacterium]
MAEVLTVKVFSKNASPEELQEGIEIMALIITTLLLTKHKIVQPSLVCTPSKQVILWPLTRNMNYISHNSIFTRITIQGYRGGGGVLKIIKIFFAFLNYFF